MVSIMSLWLPILLSAAIAFVASALIHMVLSYHNSDFGKIPSQDAVMDALRPFNIPPGDYVLPHATSGKERESPEYVDKANRGPVAFITVFPNGVPAMGMRLVQWFLFCVVVSIFAAYIAGRALNPGDPYLEVFRFAGCTAFAGYSLGLLPNSIWYGRKWSNTLKTMLDGLLYALLTAGTFGWLWPS